MRVTLLMVFVLSSLWFSALQSASSEELGVIKGVVKFNGQVPKSSVADNSGQQRELLTVDRASKGLRDVLVYLDVSLVRSEVLSGKQPTIDQVDHRFEPHMTAIRSGQSIKFTNSDPANHNVRAVAVEPKNTFNVYTSVGGQYLHTFHPQRRNSPIRLSCDIHPWMNAWIFVFEHPFYALTDAKGNFRIANVPAGNYQLVIRQPDVGYLRRAELSVAPGALVERQVELTTSDLR